MFDAVTGMEGIPGGYADMDARRSIKVLVTP